MRCIISHTNIIAFSVSLLIICGSTGILCLFYEGTYTQSIYGDGFSNETLPPFSLDGQEFILTTKVSPSILTAEDIQDRFFDLSVFDYNLSLIHI